MRMTTILAGAVLPALFLFAAEGQKPAPKLPLGLVPIPWPADNPFSPEKAELGRLLYFDNRISADATISCATCHDPRFGFTDGKAVSTGIRGQKGGRSAPTVINRAYSLAQFWDGRAATLEEQAVGPMANPIEMGNNHTTVVSTLRSIQGYKPLFRKAYGE
jgi:cytochrome c peroxidase